MSQPFDPLQMPLEGVRLIEASAGTGKTFSLASLYLRLLVEKQLDVREILVMTFTRAATRELRERIRARLTHAAELAAGKCSNDAGTEARFARDLFARARDKQPQLARRLADCARRMDEAVILTIHSFSQKAAANQAFDSALPFDRGEAIDDAQLYRELAADYWRLRVIAHHDALFQKHWPSPEALYQDLKDALNNAALKIDGLSAEAFTATLTHCRTLWHEQSDELKLLMQAATSSDQKLFIGDLKKQLSDSAAVEDFFQQIDTGLALERPLLPETLKLALTPAQYSKPKREKAEAQALLHSPILQALADLQQALPSQLLATAYDHIQERAKQQKSERQQYSFDDMISLLHEAISGPNGETLAQHIQQNWPWALVDEFQDTDPQQYDILQRCYVGRPHGGLILIGDPKQAIYSFRGGDIHAYLQAAADAGSDRYSLQANFRSSSACLKAFETLFRQAGDNPFLIEQIRFESIHAGRKDQRSLRIQESPQDGLQIWRWHSADGKATNKGAAELACEQACIAQVQQLLAHGQIINATDEHAPSQAVRAADIAILVNTNRQASQMQSALSRRGIAAVCVHQQSVFASSQASDILAVLLAVASPANGALIRSALTGPLFGQRLSDLWRLQSDEAAWAGCLQAFSAHHEQWRRHGVLAMLQNLIQAAGQRLRQQYDADRCISNYLQIAELLADAQAQCFGMNDLIHWLQTQICEADEPGGQESAQLRLESDAESVRVLTVHKSKGLEFPIVLLPYAPWLGSGGSQARTVRYHSPEGHAVLAVQPSEEQKRLAIRDQRAESLRLFYVALTRAEITCYLPWGAFNGVLDGPLAALLLREQMNPERYNPRAAPTPDDAAAALDKLLAAADGCICSQNWPSYHLNEPESDAEPASLAPARSADYGKREHWDWRMSSFSGLMRLGAASPLHAGAQDESDLLPQLMDAAEQPLPELPGGVSFGNAIHDILENLDAPSWQNFQPQQAGHREIIEQALLRHGIKIPSDLAAQGRLITLVGELLHNSLASALPQLGPLSKLPPSQRKAEMEFHLRIQRGRLGDLLRLLQAAGYARHWQADEQTLELRGLLHGYIDLITEVDQRFYVLDYKTNYLGPSISHYSTEAVASAMADHDYELQALLYQLALHRYLAQRLPHYQPQKHLGGALYLFLRGMHPARPGDGVHYLSAPIELLQQMNELLDGSAQ